MGKIRTQAVKRGARAVMEKLGDSVTEDFGKNKVLLMEKLQPTGKTFRNKVAGYLVRLYKQKNKNK